MWCPRGIIAGIGLDMEHWKIEGKARAMFKQSRCLNLKVKKSKNILALEVNISHRKVTHPTRLGSSSMQCSKWLVQFY